MEYKYSDIEKILAFTTWTPKQKIDEMFRIDAFHRTNLGSDSTLKEKELVNKKAKRIYKEISRIDPVIGSELLRSIM
jgi:hypothetical protein